MHRWRRGFGPVGGGALSESVSYVRFLSDRGKERGLDQKIAERLAKQRNRHSDYDLLADQAATKRPRTWSVVDSLKFVALHRLFQDKPLPLARTALKMARRAVDSIPSLKRRVKKSGTRKAAK